MLEFIGNEPRLLRPANYPDGTPGAGLVRGRRPTNGVRVGVINVMGRVFLHAIDDPFRAAEREIARVRERRRAGRSSSTCTPRRPPRSSRWAGTSTAR